MTTPATPAPSPVLDLCAALEDGAFVANADKALQELTAKLRNHQRNVGGKASGQLVVTVKFTDNGKEIELVPKIDLKTPTPVRLRSFMWYDKEGNLSRRNPKQMELPLVDPSHGPGRPVLVTTDREEETA